MTITTGPHLWVSRSPGWPFVKHHTKNPKRCGFGIWRSSNESLGKRASHEYEGETINPGECWAITFDGDDIYWEPLHDDVDYSVGDWTHYYED